MNDFIKQQQELAREMYKNPCEVDNCESLHNPFNVHDLNTLTQQIITNTGEELMRLAKEEKKDYSVNNFVSSDSVVASHNQAIDTIKQHITNVTGVE